MLSEKTKRIFKEIYGADLDSEELFEEMYQKNRPENRIEEVVFPKKAIKEIDEETIRIMKRWK